MKTRQQDTGNEPARRKRRRRVLRRKRVDPAGAGEARKKPGLALHEMKISDFYRPLKKAVTLRLDADVLAWFQKDGDRYQTRINAALRKVMEKGRKEEA